VQFLNTSLRLGVAIILKRAGVKCEVRGGKMRGTGARYQCEATGNLRGSNVRGATDNWHSRCRYRM